jgi:hypothetical protein
MIKLSNSADCVLEKMTRQNEASATGLTDDQLVDLWLIEKLHVNFLQYRYFDQTE